MVCFICAKSFRGRSRKIPCICGCDRLAHLSCVPGLSKEAAIKRKNGELLNFNCELCVTSVDPSVRQSPTVVLVGVDENCEVNQVVRDGLETPVAKRLKTGQDAHDTPPLPPWPSPSGTPNSSFLPLPPSQFETAEFASVCVSNSPPYTYTLLLIVQKCVRYLPLTRRRSKPPGNDFLLNVCSALGPLST